MTYQEQTRNWEFPLYDWDVLKACRREQQALQKCEETKNNTLWEILPLNIVREWGRETTQWQTEKEEEELCRVGGQKPNLGNRGQAHVSSLITQVILCMFLINIHLVNLSNNFLKTHQDARYLLILRQTVPTLHFINIHGFWLFPWYHTSYSVPSDPAKFKYIIDVVQGTWRNGQRLPQILQLIQSEITVQDQGVDYRTVDENYAWRSMRSKILYMLGSIFSLPRQTRTMSSEICS